jgi:2-methylcitrate dehydratase PrpD
MCYATHRAINCVLDLIQNSPIQAGDVKKISVSISDNASKVLRNKQPDTGLAAKFSIQFAMASGIIAKRVGLRELTDEFVQRPDVQDMMRKVEVVTTTDYDPEMPGAARADSVAVELNDGSNHPRRAGRPRHRPPEPAAD